MERRKQKRSRREETRRQTTNVLLLLLIFFFPHKGTNFFVIDISEKCNFAKTMIILEGRSGRHMRAMAERVLEEVRQYPFLLCVCVVCVCERER